MCPAGCVSSGAVGGAGFGVAPSQGRSPAWPASCSRVGCLGPVTRPGDRGHSAYRLPTGTWPHGGKESPEHPQTSRACGELCVPRGNRGTAGQRGCHTVNTLQPYRADPCQPHQCRHRRVLGPGWGAGVQGPSRLPLSIPTPCCFAEPRPWEAGDPGAPLSAHTQGQAQEFLSHTAVYVCPSWLSCRGAGGGEDWGGAFVLGSRKRCPLPASS